MLKQFLTYLYFIMNNLQNLNSFADENQSAYSHIPNLPLLTI